MLICNVSDWEVDFWWDKKSSTCKRMVVDSIILAFPNCCLFQRNDHNGQVTALYKTYYLNSKRLQSFHVQYTAWLLVNTVIQTYWHKKTKPLTLEHNAPFILYYTVVQAYLHVHILLKSVFNLSAELVYRLITSSTDFSY